MARVHRISYFVNFFVILTAVSCCFNSVVGENRVLDENNWRDILEGEWMVEFYAPWCPACVALAPPWEEMSKRLQKRALGVKAGIVDVTKSPGLSGRFVVTALPTIYHVKDGEFRQYKGPRDVDSLMSFVEQKRWQQTEPVPGWKAPHSLQMSLVAEFFRLSQALRSIRQALLSPFYIIVLAFCWCRDRFADMLMNVHNTLMETYGLPTWGSYLIFAVATIFFGSLLGLLLVCVIDLLYPPRKYEKQSSASKDDGDTKSNSDLSKSDDEQELINDDIVDDASPRDSDAERNSPSDSSDEDKENASAAGGDVKTSDSKDKPEVRKRRPRKAD